MQLNKRLDSFELKLRQLASKFERQEQEKQALEQEISSLKRELDRQRGIISSLREKLAQTTTVMTSESPAPATQAQHEMQAKIDACIKELDFCIEWLENH